MHVHRVGSGYAAALAAFEAGQSRLLSAIESMAKGDLDTLPCDWIELSLAKVHYRVGVALFRTQAEMDRSLLDIFA